MFTYQEEELLVFFLLKPSDSPLHHFPSCINRGGNRPFVPKKEATKGSESYMRCADWVSGGSLLPLLRERSSAGVIYELLFIKGTRTHLKPAWVTSSSQVH